MKPENNIFPKIKGCGLPAKINKPFITFMYFMAKTT
jgi:hypothetical protein